jgi:hypothetical protein
MERGRPGLVMAVLRYIVLTVPLAAAGIALARRVDAAPLYGVVLATLLAAALASWIAQSWLRRAVGGHPTRVRAAEPAP